jgi:Ca2+-transporting ATPase
MIAASDHSARAADLSALTAPVARVVRDGRQQAIASAEVVVGDVLVLGEGEIVAADALVLESAALLVDESALTGESVPVDKVAAPAARRPLRPRRPCRRAR